MSKAILDGYICVTERESRFFKSGHEYIHELIKMRAFDESLRKYGKVPMMFNHKSVIAKPEDVKLFEDNIGLRFEIRVDDIEVLKKATDSRITGCSFGFTAIAERRYIKKDGSSVRVVEKLKLDHVSIIDMKPVHGSVVNIRYIPIDLKEQVNRYQDTKEKQIAEYQHRIDLLKAGKTF